jgi:hypothetical protein
MTHENLVEMEIFRTGDYGEKGAWSEADLATLAADYRPDLLEAPLTFDHAQSGPAYGWVAALRREGDRLVAGLKGVPAAVIEMVRSGAYKRRSVELFRKLPHTGRPYLRAVSLLGAATPEVKGLRDVCFASQQDACTVEFGEDASAGIADAAEREPASNPQNTSGAAVSAVEARMTELFSELRRDGYCLPEQDAEALQALVSFAAKAQHEAGGTPDTFCAVAFAESSRRVDAGVECLARILRQALPRAPLGEQGLPGTASASAPAMPAVAQFSERVEPRSFALHQAAMQILAADPSLSYRDALLRVG